MNKQMIHRLAKRENYLNTYLSLLLNKCDDMHIENLAYSSSDWRSISPKGPLCKLTLNRDQSYWQRAKIICLLSSPMVFPCLPRFFFFFFAPLKKKLLLLESRFSLALCQKQQGPRDSSRWSNCEKFVGGSCESPRLKKFRWVGQSRIVKAETQWKSFNFLSTFYALIKSWIQISCIFFVWPKLLLKQLCA